MSARRMNPIATPKDWLGVFDDRRRNQGCHADDNGRIDGRSDDGRGGVRDLDALKRPF
jgi:hypothetical protein